MVVIGLVETRLRLQLHDAIYGPDSFVFMLRYCANLKAIRYETTSFNRIVADKSHRVIAALISFQLMFIFVLPPTFVNNKSNFEITSAQCFPLSAFIHTEENDDLISFCQIDDKINSYYLFI